jgi:hypothetical protein
MNPIKTCESGTVVYCPECGWNMESHTDLFVTNNGMVRADWFHWCSHCGAKGE